MEEQTMRKLLLATAAAVILTAPLAGYVKAEDVTIKDRGDRAVIKDRVGPPEGNVVIRDRVGPPDDNVVIRDRVGPRHDDDKVIIKDR
jgi:hypothetical protein